MKKLTLNKIVTKLKLKILSGHDKMDMNIEVYGINRAGLELAGYFEKGERSHRLILMSSKELNYIMQFNEQERVQRYKKLLQVKFPGVILTSKFDDKIFLEVARKLDFPVVMGDSSTQVLSKDILDILDDYLSPQIELHASFINVFGKGILFIGESGIGKSELAMDLIKLNHLFVGDDRIVITKKNGRLFGKSHEILKNLVEVRGIGIIDVAKIHGYKVIMNESPIDMVIELSIFKKNGVDDSERLGHTFEAYRILDLEIPYLKIPVSLGRNIQNIIEVAVSKLKIAQSGLYEDETSLLNQRLDKFKENE